MFELNGIYWPQRLSLPHARLAPGMSVAVIGPNGAGKSSLLQLLNGQVHPPQGSITLDDRPLETYTPIQLARRRAYLPQSTATPPALTVEALVNMGQLPGQALLPERLSAFKEVLGLDALWHRRLETLSGGERQRAQLGRVLMQAWATESDRPRALFLDESLNSLDIHFQQSLLNYLTQCTMTGELSLLWVTHDLNQAAQFSDQAWLLANNCLQASAPIKKLAQDGILSRHFQWPLTWFECTGAQGIYAHKAAKTPLSALDTP